MTTKQELETALHDALRSGDETRKKTLRMILSAVKFYEIEKRIPSDETVIASILQKEVKSRKETIDEAEKANRLDIVADTKAEILVIEGFLPKSIPEDELREMIKVVIQETGASKPADMGKVMKALLPKLQGRAPSDVVSRLVKETLQS